MAICLAGAGAVVRLALAAFTLTWTHTVENLPWQEDWQVANDGLRLVAVRIKGSGAGIEPPPEARLDRGWYRWNPDSPPRPHIVLRRAHAAGVDDWHLCLSGGADCRPIGAVLGHDADPVTIAPCR